MARRQPPHHPALRRKGRKLRQLSDAAVFDDGETVGFCVDAFGTKKLDVFCSIAELGDIFSFLGNLAKAAGDLRAAPTPPMPQAHNYLAPVPAQGAGFQAGSTPDETLLVVRLFGFDMAFAVPSSGLARIADELGRIARTLSAGPSRPQ